MTETSRCLDSHPKFLCIVGAPIFSLQAHNIQQTFPWSRKFQRQFSHYLLCPAECLADSFMNQESQKIISPLGKFSSPLSAGSLCPVYTTVQARAVSCPKWLTNSIRSLFDAHLPFEVDWCCQEQTCLIVMKSPKLLKHWKCHICSLWKIWRMPIWNISMHI